MKENSNPYKTLNTGRQARDFWSSFLLWLRLLVLSFTRNKEEPPGIFFHEPIPAVLNKMILANIPTPPLKIKKMPNTNLAKLLVKWALMLLFTAFGTNAIAQAPPPIPGDHSVCINTTKEYGVVLNAGSTYAWSITPSTGYTLTPNSTYPNLITVTWSAVGVYTVRVVETNVEGCVGDTVSIVVTVNPLPTVTVNSSTVCEGTAATITATPGEPGTYNYVWTVPAGVPDPGNVASFTSTVAGTYSVVITNTATGCVSASASGTVTVNPLPVCSITGNNNICPATSSTYSGPLGMTTYNWSISGNATITGATNGQTVLVLANNSCGNFTLTLTVIDANGCTSTCTQTFDITQPPFTFNQPADTTVAACNFADQTALNAAITAWVSQRTTAIAAAGGCAPQVTSNFTNQTIDLCAGGNITITWTITDKCDTTTVDAIYTVTPAPALAFSQPADTTVAACNFADQTALNAAIAAWVSQRTTAIAAAGGCAPQVTSNFTNQSINLCDGGNITITWTITDKCDTTTVDAIYTVTPAPALAFNQPADTTVAACNFTDQTALNAAITAWVSQRTTAIAAAGGCAPQVTSNFTNQTIDLCAGGNITITWTITDKCDTTTVDAIYTVTPAPALAFNQPADTTVAACNFADQTTLNAAITAWVSQRTTAIAAAGGCAPQVTSNFTNQSINLCDGGNITITWTITDKCDTTTVDAIYTVTPAPALAFSQPADTTVAACNFADQTTLNAAITAWVSQRTTAIAAAGGCAPQVTSNFTNQTIDLCAGGNITITWTITDKCDTTTVDAIYTVTPAPALAFNQPADTTVAACNFADQTALNAAITAWVSQRTTAIAAAGGCAPQVSSNFTNQSINLCDGGNITITWTITDKCDTTTVDAIYTVTPAPALAFSQPADTTVAACNFADQTALNAAITAWVSQRTTAIAAAGGCAPQVTSNFTNQTIDLCAGGNITITWTITDKCDTTTVDAIYTVTPAPALAFNQPADTTVAACNFADQTTLNAAITAWVSQRTTAIAAAGGCAPQVTSNFTNQTINLCDGGNITITWTITDKCDTTTVDAIYTVTPAPALAFNQPADTTVAACNFADQTALNAAIAAWVSQRTTAIAAAGGCAPQVTSNFTNQTIDLCAGGNITITWTITDKCDTTTVDAIYTVTPAPALAFNQPADTTVAACNFADQTALNAAITAWVSQRTTAIAAAGGCAPQVTSNFTNQTIDLCAGGNITITWTITDKCDTTTVDAIYTVTPAPALAFNQPADTTVAACNFADQTALNAAITAWVSQRTTAIAAAGGCAPQVTSNFTNQTIDLCAGGNITITWTITDKCDTTTVDAIYTVTPAPALAFNQPADTTVAACNFTDQTTLNAAITAWVSQRTTAIAAAGGCAPQVTSNFTNQTIDLCAGGNITITWTITDKCDTTTVDAIYTVTPAPALAFNQPADTTVAACNFADQTALNAAITAWVSQRTTAIAAAGGCAPQVTSNFTNQTIDLCAGGNITITWTITDKCDTTTVDAIYTVTPAPALAFNQPADTTVAACNFADQTTLNAAITAWVSQRTTAIAAAGGCAPQVTSNFTNQSINLCDGGNITITWTITDKCDTTTVDAIYTVTPAPALAFSQPADTTVAACNFADQTTLNAAIAAWVSQRTTAIAAAGGCAPQVTSNFTNQTIDLCAGGNITITWTITDKCDTTTVDAIYTVTPAPALAFNQPADTTVAACNFTDQTALNAAITAWVSQRTTAIAAAGGCAPQVSSNFTNQSINLCDGGNITITWTITDKCDTTTVDAIYTVTPAPALAFSQPADTTVAACNFADQTALNAAIAAWVSQRTTAIAAAGGCAPQVTSNFTNQSINLCDGGNITITWTITDKCDTTTVDAIYTVTPAPALAFSQPADTTVAACNFADQTALNAAITAWVSQRTTAIAAAGGCAPQVTSNFTNQSINLCDGGNITITWTITDKCDTTTVDAIYTVTPAPALAFSQPADTTVAACNFADQTALNAAITAWVSQRTTAIAAAGGCAPQVSSNFTNQSINLCDGGNITITWTITDKCDTTTVDAIYTVTPAPALAFSQPADTTVAACNFADQTALNAAIAAWVSQRTTAIAAAGGCAPQVTSNFTNQSINLCDGGNITITWTITDKCDTTTVDAIYTVTPAPALAFSQPADTTVAACNFADQTALNAAITAWVSQRTTAIAAAGGCAPQVTSNFTNQSINLCDGGNITITWTITDKCDTTTVDAIYTVTPAPALAFNQPADTTVAACNFADQTTLNAAIAAWVSQRTTAIAAAGGCAPQVTSNFTNQSINLCDGGNITITWTITDKCDTTTVDAIYTVTPAPALAFSQPADTTVAACNFADQTALNAAITAWVSQRTTAIAAAGGCAPQVTSNFTNQSINLCDGGNITITWTITDKCDTTTVDAIYTVTPAPALAFNQPADTTVGSCSFADQTTLNAAIAAWVSQRTTAIAASGGCAPQVTSNFTNQSINLCAGGNITITWTITDKCDTTTVDAIYTVTPAPPVQLTCPPLQTLCVISGDIYTVPALIATDGCSRPLAIIYEVTGATTRSGTGTDASGVFNVGVSTITWRVTDACGNVTTCTTTVTINPKPVTTPITHN